MADISHHFLLWEYPEYQIAMWGPVVGPRVMEAREREEERKRLAREAEEKKREGKQKRESPDQNSVGTPVHAWIDEIEQLDSPDPEDVNLTYQQKLLEAGGQTGGWQDELIDDDLFYVEDRKEVDAEDMNDAEWAEGMTRSKDHQSLQKFANNQQLAKTLQKESLAQHWILQMLCQCGCRDLKPTSSYHTGISLQLPIYIVMYVQK